MPLVRTIYLDYILQTIYHDGTFLAGRLAGRMQGWIVVGRRFLLAPGAGAGSSQSDAIAACVETEQTAP